MGGLIVLAGQAVGAAAARAQGVGATPPPLGGLGDLLPGMETLIVVAVLVIVAVAAALLLARRRQAIDWTPRNFEPEPEPSPFEQLLAEIQGVSLRIKGAAGRGFYRKIDMLGRIFLERLGHKNARTMNDDQIGAVLREGSLSEAQGQMLATIFERCRQGAEHESEKLDFNANELLKDLRTLVLQVDESHTLKHEG
jgi:hypothetical protein